MDQAIAGEMDSRATSVLFRDLSVRAGRAELLRSVSARLPAGQITLIIGRSGVGKSTLLRAIAGLISPRDEQLHVTGSVQLCRDSDGQVHDRGSVGVVFQEFALFDELTPLQNVRLAMAHRVGRNRRKDDPDPQQLLDELGVPTDVGTAALSGGQRQRLAIARVLAYDGDVVLYDEPTSGLDTATAGDVARFLQATHARHRRTSIIVTHDYEALAPIADHIYLIDSRTHALKPVSKDQWDRLSELLEATEPASLQGAVPARSGLRRWTAPIADTLVRFLVGTSRVTEAALQVPANLLPIWKSPWWGIRFAMHYLRSVAGISAWLYIAIAGAIIGFVTTYFTFRFLPSAEYTEPLVIEDLLRSMGFALYRVLVPILMTILIAARCGAAVASDVGGKCYGRQIDALRTLGVRPKRYLLTGILYAFLIGTPVLLFIGYSVAAATSLVVFTATHPERGPWFWQRNFYRELVVPDQLLYGGTDWLLGKTLLCAVGIALIAYYQGARPKDSTRAVSQGVTSTILWATLFVLMVHFVFAFLEF